MFQQSHSATVFLSGLSHHVGKEGQSHVGQATHVRKEGHVVRPGILCQSNAIGRAARLENVHEAKSRKPSGE